MSTKKPRTNWQDRIPGPFQSLQTIAQGAGLRTSSALTKDGELEMIWRGTEAQFRATGLFLQSMRFPITGCRVISPWYFEGDIIEREEGGTYTLRSVWALPCEVAKSGPAILYRYKDGSETLYGSVADLQAAGVTRPLPIGGRKVTRLYRLDRQERVSRWPDGSWSFFRESEAAAQARAAERERREAEYAAWLAPQTTQPEQTQETSRSNHKSPADFARHVAEVVRLSVISTLNVLAETDTESGWRYTFSKAAIAAISESLGELVSEITDARILAAPIDLRTDADRLAACKRVAVAETDPTFKRFMRELLPSEERKVS